MADPVFRTHERGSILVLVLIMVLPLAAMSGAMILLGSRLGGEQDAARGRARALLHAESGLDQAFARLASDPSDLSTLEATEEDGQTLRYRVTFEDLGEDGADNDGDGDVDEADEAGRIRMTSAGSLNVTGYDAGGQPIGNGGRVHVKQLRALGVGSDPLPHFPYAVYLGDPLAQLRLNGNAFKIDGKDHDGTGALKGTAAVPGIATVGAVSHISNQLSKQQKDNVTGQGGPPSIHNTAKLDLQKLIDQYKSAADIQFIQPDKNFTGSLGDYDKHDSKITYVQGTLKIAGGGTGCGIMLVEGNLDISGGFEYRGVIIVTGQVIMRGGGGGKRVVGSLLVGGDVVNAGQTSTDLEVSGTVDLYYSGSIQDEVGKLTSKFTLTGWQEL